MKRFLLAILLIGLSLAGCAGRGTSAADKGTDGSKVLKSELNALCTEYKSCKGFEVVCIGSLGTSILRKVLAFTAKMEDDYDEDIRVLLAVSKDVKGVAIVDYEDSSKNDRDEFNARLGKILTTSDLLMEARDGDDLVQIYGIVSEDGSHVRDFVLHSAEDCALVCLFGSIPMEAVSDFVKSDM